MNAMDNILGLFSYLPDDCKPCLRDKSPATDLFQTVETWPPVLLPASTFYLELEAASSISHIKLNDVPLKNLHDKSKELQLLDTME